MKPGHCVECGKRLRGSGHLRRGYFCSATHAALYGERAASSWFTRKAIARIPHVERPAAAKPHPDYVHATTSEQLRGEATS